MEELKTMTFNYDNLKKLIISKYGYGNLQRLADDVKMAYITLWRKLNNQSFFNNEEILKLSKVLHIDNKDIAFYFLKLS